MQVEVAGSRKKNARRSKGNYVGKDFALLARRASAKIYRPVASCKSIDWRNKKPAVVAGGQPQREFATLIRSQGILPEALARSAETRIRVTNAQNEGNDLVSNQQKTRREWSHSGAADSVQLPVARGQPLTAAMGIVATGN
jgi:hypothetical protein